MSGMGTWAWSGINPVPSLSLFLPPPPFCILTGGLGEVGRRRWKVTDRGCRVTNSGWQVTVGGWRETNGGWMVIDGG